MTRIYIQSVERLGNGRSKVRSTVLMLSLSAFCLGPGLLLAILSSLGCSGGFFEFLQQEKLIKN